MSLHQYSDPDPNPLGRQGGSLRWSIPAQARRDLGLSDGEQPAWYAVDDETGALVISFEDVDVREVVERAARERRVAVEGD